RHDGRPAAGQPRPIGAGTVAPRIRLRRLRPLAARRPARRCGGRVVNREAMLARVAARREPWDILVVGGGATGLGAAVDAASRGYATLLVEQGDFAKGTSSRSTKLIHGGVRYLKQGNIALVLEALHERGVLMANAPHLVRNL